MMDCLEFRRSMLSRPVRLAPEQDDHLRRCPNCGRAANRAKSFESNLRKALDIPVPVGIEGRILHRRDIRQHWRWAGVAVLAVVALSTTLWLADRGDDPRSTSVVTAHHAR